MWRVAQKDEAGEKSRPNHWDFVNFANVDLILYVYSSQSLTCVISVKHELILGVLWYIDYFYRNILEKNLF